MIGDLPGTMRHEVARPHRPQALSDLLLTKLFAEGGKHFAFAVS